MKKLKDIFYDYNDVIIAFAILVIAALLIIWRMDAILEYPDKILENNDQPAVDTPVVDNDSDSDASGSDDSGSDEDSNNDSEDTPKDDESQSNTTAQLWSNGALSREVTVDVTGSSASEAIQCLVDAGLFDSYSDYQTVCTDMGLDHEKVSAGTFTFKSGTTKNQIADAINWG